jgi:MYXO-CTERM domain-containing protein
MGLPLSLRLHTAPRPLLGLLVAGLVLGTAARAEAAALGTVTLTPSFETAGVIVQLSADSGNETVTVEIKGPSDTDFHPAHGTVLFEPHAHGTSLFALKPDTDYALRVTLSDPDGVTGPATQMVTLHTRAEPKLPAPTRVRWVGPGGNDAAGSGTTNAAPYATPGYALSQAQPGDEIRVLAGTYPATSTDGIHGTDALPIVLRADDPAAKPVIDGAMAGAAMYLNDAAYVVIDGFEVRNGGDDAGGHGIYLRASSHVTVRNSFIHDNGHEDILVSKGAEFSGGLVAAGFHLIEDNDIADLVHETCVGASNTACSGQTYTGIKQDNNPGGGTVIRRNEIHGHVDNISPCGDEVDGRDLAEGSPVLALLGAGPWGNHDLEIYDNTVEDARDDGMELDGICVNARVYRNTIHNAQNPFSAAPVMPGPYFFVRNVVTGSWGDAGFKMNTSGNSAVPSRHVFVYQNTFARSDKGTLINLWFAVEGDHNVPLHDVVFRNNVFSAPLGGQATNASNHGMEQPSFDGNVWWTTDTTNVFSWWNGSANDHYDSFAAFQTGASTEAHGAFGEPGLGADYVPTKGALVVDRGLLIPGINDGFAGAAPDVGAFELGGTGPMPTTATGVGGSTSGPSSGVTSGTGAGVGGSGGAGGDGAGSSPGGCGCVVAGSGERPSALGMIGVIALGLWSRRRGSARRALSKP